MGELRREYLNSSIMLSRTRDGSSQEQYFIKDVIGEGNSSVCYEATRILKDGIRETGKLKEYYPFDFGVGGYNCNSLERLPNGQLIPKKEIEEIFDGMCDDYLESYKILRDVVVENSQNEILKSYIQYGEILYGCREDNKEQPTVYIWSPGISGQGFDGYLLEVRKKPDEKPEEKLKNILSVVDVLTDCIKALHTAGLMHLDIKPSNFLVQYDSDYKIKPGNISLFDVDTLCSVNSKFLRVAGTKGFWSPEVEKKKRPDNRSDIYSLGAMLFNALVITKDVSDGLYKNSYYTKIPQLVKDSELFRSSEVNSDVVLMSGICKILEKCLNMNPKRRYQSCSELKQDLEKMRNYLDEQLWSVSKQNKSELAESIVNIQKVLYEHPLYEVVAKDTKDINVLVIGSGTYAQKFIDLCLQAGQMSDIGLKITAISECPEKEKESYLYFRPAISEFININGSLKESLAYATIEFKENIGISKEIKEKEYNYVFVTLEEDTDSKSVAQKCSKDIYDQWGYRCPVCYVSQKIVRENRVDTLNKIYSVCINEPVDVAAIDQKLGEMAFNTHISWNDTMNIDMEYERRKFFEGRSYEEKYNRNSSIAFALSIKYKLHSIGIEYENLTDGALQFSKKILEARFTDEEAKRKYNCLVDLEHRRWLIEKATDGWTAPRDANGNLKLEECIARESVKDTVNKTHPCIVRGSETAPLNGIDYLENNYAKWDKGKIDSNLDELDRMSIELHRCFKNHVEEIRKEDFFQNKDVLYIQNNIPNDCGDIQKAFKQFKFALENIMNGVEKYSKEYKNYLNRFEKTLNELPDETRIKIENRLKVLKHNFFPMVESNLYRNYKAYDEVLVNNIPFILSYQYMPAMAVIFEDGIGQNKLNFTNVASATVLNPERLQFLYYVDKKSSINFFIKKFKSVLNYFNGRNLHCGIDLAVCISKETADIVYDELQTQLIILKNEYKLLKQKTWIENVKIYRVEDKQEAVDQFMEHLKKYPVDLFDIGNQLFSQEKENREWLESIKDLSIPYFEFDWINKKFVNCVGCKYLEFVQDGSFLRIQGMFALMNTVDDQFSLPEYIDDYKSLWDIYIGNDEKRETAVQSWYNLCMILQQYDKAKKPLAKIKIHTNEDSEYKKLVYFLPEYVFMETKKILRELIQHGIVTEQSNIMNYTSDTCKLELEAEEEYVEQLNIIFANPQMLLEYYQLEVCKYTQENVEYVEIKYNNLAVEKVDLKQDESIFRILQQLEAANFITNIIKIDSDHVSFRYSSPRIKKVLTRPAEILKIYAYYDILKTGYFDDVISGYTYREEGDATTKEIDLVVTKEFKSMIIECRSMFEIKTNKDQIQNSMDQFGDEIQKVLLTDMCTECNKYNFLVEDIMNIGQTLKKVMENRN